MYMTTHADMMSFQTAPTSFDEPVNMENDPRTKMDDKLFVQFYKRAVINNFKTSQEGRPIFDELDYVRIIVPGSKDVLDVEATDDYTRRFPKHWERYRAKQEQTLSGTPLEVWPQMTVGIVAELKAMNIHTVEQLATIPDVVAGKFQGGQTFKQRAQAFLDAAAGDAANSKLATELALRDEEIDILKKQMEALTASLQAQTKPIEKAK
jgi:hypothetical protein